MAVDTAFTQFPTLLTPRLQLRRMDSADREAFYAIRSDPEVTLGYGREPYQSLEEVDASLQRIHAGYERRESFFWGITLKGEETVIGTGLLWNLDADFHTGEIGYELRRASWRQGIISEASAAILSYGFGELGLHRIEAIVDEENSASRALLLKLGFTCEGRSRQQYFFRGRHRDILRFGLLHDEWSPPFALDSL